MLFHIIFETQIYNTRNILNNCMIEKGLTRSKKTFLVLYIEYNVENCISNYYKTNTTVADTSILKYST